MRIISPKMLRKFWELYPEAESPLSRWWKLTSAAEWNSFIEVQNLFGTRVDQHNQFTIFDIGGNKYRLIAAIHYNTGRVYIRHVLTHAEYDRGKWKQE